MSEKNHKDVGDEEQVKKGQLDAKKRDELAKERLRQIMQLPQAQDWFFDFLDELFVFRTSWHPSGSQMAFNEGERNVGLKLMDRWIDASPDSFFNTMKRKKGAKNV